MMEFLTAYYGIDIFAMGITFLGIYYIGNKNRIGFVMTIIGNILWIWFGVMATAGGVIFANVVLIILSTRNYLKWTGEMASK